MPDNLTTRVKEELARRGTIVSDDQVNLFLKSQGIDPVSPQQTSTSRLQQLGIRPAAAPKREQKDNILDLVGSALWHGFDTAAFGLPGISLGEDAPYKWGEMGMFGNIGAVFGEAAGFLVPLSGISRLTAKGVAATSKYGAKAASAKASEAVQSFAKNEKILDAAKAGKVFDEVLQTRAAKGYLSSYGQNMSTLRAAETDMARLISGSFKDAFPTVGDDLIEQMTQSSLKGLSTGGVHVNNISSWVQKALGATFNKGDKTFINTYVGRAAELTANFSLYNLIDDGIKSLMVEGHEFDPVADVGHALMFSALLPAVEAIPGGGRMKIFKTRKDVRSGLAKIKGMDYKNLDTQEVNAIFKIISNRNSLKNSSFAQEAALRWGNAFKANEQELAAKHLKALFSKFNPDQVYRELRRAVGTDLITALPRMTVGALYFNASTLMDANLLRNIEPEILGAHLLTGALFTRRYKPIMQEKFPTLNNFEQKVEFLKILGYDAEQIKYLGTSWGIRGDTAAVYSGLLSHPIMRQIVEKINTEENIKQSKDGRNNVGALSEPHSFISQIEPLYVLSENSKKVALAETDPNPDVKFQNLKHEQLMEIDAGLRKILIEEGKSLNEENFADVREKIFKDITEGTYQGYMATMENVARMIGVQIDKEPGEPFDMKKAVGVARIRGLKAFDGNEKYEAVSEWQIMRNRLEALGYISEITQKEPLTADKIDAKALSEGITEQFNNLRNKILEDNYAEGSVTDGLVNITDNQFLESLKNYKRERSLNALYNFTEGRTQQMTDSDASLFNAIGSILPENAKFESLKKPSKITEEEWSKIQAKDEFFRVREAMSSLSDILNISSRGESEGRQIDYDQAKSLINSLISDGFKVDADMYRTFEKYYYKRLLNSKNFGIKHIAMVKNGLEHRVFRVEERKGKKVLVIPDKIAVRKALQEMMTGEELEGALAKYDVIRKELNAINGSFMRVESELPLTDSLSSDVYDFITDSYSATSRFDRDVINEWRKLPESNREKIGVLGTIDTVIEKVIDVTDPDNPVSKKLTAEEALELSESLTLIRGESGNNMSPEVQGLLDMVISKLSNKNVGEDGMIEPGNVLVSLREILDPSLEQLKYINDTVTGIVFNHQSRASDRISGKKRMDALVSDLVRQLEAANIKVEDGATLTDLQNKFFNSGLSLEQKLDRGIDISIEDFSKELNTHLMSWYSSNTVEQFHDAQKKARDSFGDSSLKDRDISPFKKINKVANQLKDYNSFFKTDEENQSFAISKEKMRRAVYKKDINLLQEEFSAVLGEAKNAFNIMHKDTPEVATKEYRDFVSSAFKELVFGTLGTTSIRSLKLTRADRRYILSENKAVAGEAGAAKYMKEFEEAGFYMALLEKEGVILDDRGKIRQANNIFSLSDLDTKYITDAKFGVGEQAAKERGTKEILGPEGASLLRIPMSFSTQMVVDKRGMQKSTEVLSKWYNDKIKILKEGVKNKQISSDVLSNFEALFKSLMIKDGDSRPSETLKDIEFKQVMRAMYWDRMNSKAFNRVLESATAPREMDVHLASMFKYLSLSEGIGAKSAGNETALSALLKLNKSKDYLGEILTPEQSESIEYYFDKKKELGKNPIEIISINDKKQFDTLKIVKRELKKLVKNPNIKDSVNHTIQLAENIMKSLDGKSSVDAGTYVGTHLWNLSLLNKAREFNDGVGGVKQSVSYNDGINTMLLKQNFTYDPEIANIIDKLGIDAITFDSAAKEFSREQIEPSKLWNGERLSEFFSDAIGKKVEPLRKSNVQNVSIEDILFVKAEDRHNVTNITYALSEYLNKSGLQNFLEKYANYDGVLSSGNELLSGLVSTGGGRLGSAEFVLNTLAEEGALIEGSTNAYVKNMVASGLDPSSVLVRDNVSTATYRTIINRLRKPSTDGASYAAMIPFLEGSMPVYSTNKVQIRFGGKKLPFADGTYKVNNFEKIQYIVDVGGKEALVGRVMGPDKKPIWKIHGEEKIKLNSKEKVLLKKQTKFLDDIIKRYRRGTNLSTLHELLKPQKIWLESLSLRMPNLAADVAVHKVEGFYVKEMGNVVGVNILDLATKHQGDFDADMLFSYTDTQMQLTDAVAQLTPRRMDARVYEAGEYDFRDIWNNKESLEPAGSLTDPIDSMDKHIQTYNISKDMFGRMKRMSSGINSLNRIDMQINGKKMMALEGNSLENFIQRHSNVLQSLIDTTKRPNYLSSASIEEIRRFVLFGDKPKTLDIKLDGYQEAGYKGIFSDVIDKVEGPYEKEVYKDAIAEVVDALGRPSRIMSDVYDTSGRRVPDQRDLIDMRSEISFLGANPSQFIFNRLNSKYRYDVSKRDALLKMFYNIKEENPVQELRDRIKKGLKSGKPVAVEKKPFFHSKDKVGEIFDSTPAGYVLNRIGNVKNIYERTKQGYGIETKKLSRAIDNIENFIALSDVESQEDIMETLKLADEENAISFGLTGAAYETKVTDFNYIQRYSTAYNLLKRNANDIRSSLQRNGKSTSGRISYLKDKLYRTNALIKHMEAKEDGIMGKLLQEDPDKKLLSHFNFKSTTIPKGKVKNRKNYSYSKNMYVYKQTSQPGKWEKRAEVLPQSKIRLEEGKYMMLENPLRYDISSKHEVIDAYSMLHVVGKIESNNIRGLDVTELSELRFISQARRTKAMISAIAQQTYKISEGHPESRENWRLENKSEVEIIDSFMKEFVPASNYNKELFEPKELETLYDVAGYLIRPDPVFGNIVYARDRNMALPAFKINKRVTNAVFRWLFENGHQEIAEDIARKYGNEFRRRYDDVVGFEYEGMYADNMYREKNYKPSRKSEVYNLIAENDASFLYQAAISEALKDDMAFRSSKVKQARDINGDMYKIARFGSYKDIEPGINPFADPKSGDRTTNLDCY